MQMRKTFTILGLLLANWSVHSQVAKAVVLGISAEIGDGPAEIGFQQFIPSNDPAAKDNLDTLQFNETVFPPGGQSGPVTNNGVAWWDVDISVMRVAIQDRDEMIALDKFVLNDVNSGIDWDDFHMTLGMRNAAGDFMESDESDGLYFKTDPAPVNEGGFFTAGPTFINPPQLDNPVNPDNLWWKGGTLESGLDTSFWLGLNIPDAKFLDPNGDGIEVAQITIRQHATVATSEPHAIPGTVLILGLGLLLLRKKQNNSIEN